jgi:hypothetical protein
MPKRGVTGGSDENMRAQECATRGSGSRGKGNNNLAAQCRGGTTKLTDESQRKRKTYDFVEAPEVVRFHFLFWMESSLPSLLGDILD